MKLGPASGAATSRWFATGQSGGEDEEGFLSRCKLVGMEMTRSHCHEDLGGAGPGEPHETASAKFGIGEVFACCPVTRL